MEVREPITGTEQSGYDLIAKLLESSFTGSLRTEGHIEKAKLIATQRLLRAQQIHKGEIEDDGSDPLALDAYRGALGEDVF